MSAKQSLIDELALIDAIHQKRCINSLHYTLKYFWDIIIQDKFTDNWHIPYLCTELEQIIKKAQAREKKDHDLIINIPPGTSKSTIVTIIADVWTWLQDPSMVMINSSYSSGLSIDHSLKFSTIVHSDLFNDTFQSYFKSKYGKELKFEKDTEAIITNNFGGSRIATSTGGTITGKHAHIIKRDDPIDPEQAESKAYRDKANRFNDRTLSTRRKDKESTVTITVMQRLHESDTTGNELKKEKKRIKHICLPAEKSDLIKPKELVNNYINGLLDINRLSKSILNDIKIDIGSYGYSGQFMQNPTPEGGGKIKEVWFQFIKERELPYITWDLWIDGAYTKNTENDPTGLMIAGVHNNMMYIKHAVSKYMDMPELLKYIDEYSHLHGLTNRSICFIEPKASGLSLIQMLRQDTYLNAIKIKGKLIMEGKEARIQTSAPKIESGKVILVEGSWNDDFINQLIGFPNREHDEYVDLIGYACDKYFIKKRRMAG
jgi:predicted phage terminase large subunit-like protein